MTTQHIYCMRASDEENTPFIDFERPENGANIPWGLIGSVLLGEETDDKYVSVNLRVYTEGAGDWHCYPVPGTFGLFSQAVIDLIGPHMKQCFEFFEATVNDLPYYFLRQIGTLDCLDREHSELVPFPHDPSRVMRIKRYRFHKQEIADPIVFVVPETSTEIFTTQGIKDALEEAKLRGIVFVNAEEIGR